jgi:hypothetical protein
MNVEDMDLARSDFVCPYCHEDFSELSEAGRENHENWCRIVVGIPNREDLDHIITVGSSK